MFTYKYPMVSCAATIFLYTKKNDNIDMFLLGKRSATADAYPNWYCLIGGMLDSGQEEVEDTAVREVFEETGLVIDKAKLQLICVSSNPANDPRAHVINIVYGYCLDSDVIASAADDISDLAWIDSFNPKDIKVWNWLDQEYPLAFNHEELLKLALERLG